MKKVTKEFFENIDSNIRVNNIVKWGILTFLVLWYLVLYSKHSGHYLGTLGLIIDSSRLFHYSKSWCHCLPGSRISWLCCTMLFIHWYLEEKIVSNDSCFFNWKDYIIYNCIKMIIIHFVRFNNFQYDDILIILVTEKQREILLPLCLTMGRIDQLF